MHILTTMASSLMHSTEYVSHFSKKEKDDTLMHGTIYPWQILSNYMIGH
uniref:Uncharacterized protein n=1 Tax=Arundo donax TaxID=35708 RepID=A0A0A9BHS2_ARUDO